MRVLPLDFNELWAFEVDFEYSGRILLHIETRLEIEEPELQMDLMINVHKRTSSVTARPKIQQNPVLQLLLGVTLVSFQLFLM